MCITTTFDADKTFNEYIVDLFPSLLVHIINQKSGNLKTHISTKFQMIWLEVLQSVLLVFINS